MVSIAFSSFFIFLVVFSVVSLVFLLLKRLFFGRPLQEFTEERGFLPWREQRITLSYGHRAASVWRKERTLFGRLGFFVCVFFFFFLGGGGRFPRVF